MNIEELRSYCLSKKGATEEFPFDDVTLVFKVMGRMFAATNLEGDLSVNLKCDPEKAVEIREQFPEVSPGYHMNKKHWNTVAMDGSLEQDQIRQWIDHSYDLVTAKLRKQEKEILAEM